MYGEAGGVRPHFGLNLFFDNVPTAPGITVFAPINGGAIATTGANTVTLAGASTPGANSLSYSSGGTTVTLTDYAWFAPTATGLPVGNRISMFSDTPGGNRDFRGFFVVDVTYDIPEPETWTFLLLGLLGLGFARKRF
jgi:hypothetical protein